MVEHYSATKRRKCAICGNISIDEPGGHFDKSNKSDRERQYCIVSLTCRIQNKINEIKIEKKCHTHRNSVE